MEITNEQEYEEALSELENLLVVYEDIDHETIEEITDIINDIADALDKYEEIHYPIDEPSEEAKAEFRADQERKL